MSRRNGSIFHPPSRRRAYQLASLTYADAIQLAKDNGWQKGWKGFAQALGVVSKVVEVDRVMTGCKNPLNVREVHPEICFRALNGEKPVSPKKIKGKIDSKGINERKDVLRRSSLPIDKIFEHAHSRFLSAKAIGDDDILDALVAAVTAKLVCQGKNYELRTLPDAPPRDCKGLPMEMVYAIKKSD